jgi:hypothetical protein
MEKRIKDRYNDSIFQQVRQFYGIGGDDIRLLDGFESFIYEFDRRRGVISCALVTASAAVKT